MDGATVWRPGDSGLTTGVSLTAVAIALVLVALLALMGAHAFAGGPGTAHGGHGSILSTSNAETQLKLCAEGRDSTYGHPPTAAQQAACTNRLAGQISGGGAGLPTAP